MEVAVDLCMKTARYADALILASSGSTPELNTRVKEQYIQLQTASYIKVFAAMSRNELEDLVSAVDLSQWRETLALICTWAKPHETSRLCDFFGSTFRAEE